FRYQLTVVGQFAQAIIASKVQNNRFSIKTSAPNVEVSWQVTGVRSDAALLKHPFKSEEDKPANERGYFLSPDAYGLPEERGIAWATNPQLMRQLKERREEMTHTPPVNQQQYPNPPETKSRIDENKLWREGGPRMHPDV